MFMWSLLGGRYQQVSFTHLMIHIYILASSFMSKKRLLKGHVTDLGSFTHSIHLPFDSSASFVNILWYLKRRCFSFTYVNRWHHYFVYVSLFYNQRRIKIFEFPYQCPYWHASFTLIGSYVDIHDTFTNMHASAKKFRVLVTSQ